MRELNGKQLLIIIMVQIVAIIALLVIWLLSR